MYPKAICDPEVPIYSSYILLVDSSFFQNRKIGPPKYPKLPNSPKNPCKKYQKNWVKQVKHHFLWHGEFSIGITCIPFISHWYSIDIPSLPGWYNMYIPCICHLYPMYIPFLCNLQGLVSMSRYVSHHPTLFWGYFITDIGEGDVIHKVPTIGTSIPSPVDSDDLWMICGWFMDDLWMICGWFMDDLWMIYGWFTWDMNPLIFSVPLIFPAGNRSQPCPAQQLHGQRPEENAGPQLTKTPRSWSDLHTLKKKGCQDGLHVFKACFNGLV